GVHQGLVTGKSEARIWMTDPLLSFLSKTIQVDGGISVGFANTGVPHVVVFSDDLENGSFEKNAPELRSHHSFGSDGANVNWAKVHQNGSLEMRTFERGVEGETLACGTGAVASALLAVRKYESVNLPVVVRVRSGLDLTVGRDSVGWWLQGESRVVYRAETIC
ncbi:MAG: diaminopimelate epimerase, partial [bacterium]|nr:diaminopimelate epimerase [bacterium]